jgi:short-subunit dehydrogenase
VQNELKDTGITITSLMPGRTATDFFRRADMLDTKVGSDPDDEPATVARQGFEALMKGKNKIITGGVATKTQGATARVLPDSVKAAMHRSMAEPGSAGS